MHRQQLRKKASRPISSRIPDRVARGPSSYLKTRIRGLQLQNAARILAFIELTRRLHQAYAQAYDKQAADRLLPQNPTATDLLIDRARQLLAQPNRNDCRALVELTKYAGDLFENVIDATNQLGNILAGGDVARLGLRAIWGKLTGRHETSQPIVDGFGSAGFVSYYQDAGSSPNQVRHAVGGLLAGMSRGMNGLTLMNANEPDPTGDGAADIRLNGVMVPLGADLQLHNGKFGTNRSLAGRDRMRQLARDIEKGVCDPNVK